MSLLDRVRTRTGSDLSDAELTAMMGVIAGQLDARHGPVGPITVELGELDDPASRGPRTLRLNRPIGVGEVTIVEIDPGDSGDVGAELELSAGDYRVLHGGRTLQRLTGGPNGRSHWAPLVRITYSPADAPQAARDEATIKLMLLDLSYRGLIKSEKAGDYQWQASLTADSYAAERENIIASVGTPGGMVLA